MKNRMVNMVALTAAAALVLMTIHAKAGPNDYIRLPIVEYGEREIDYKGGIHSLRNGQTESAHAIGYGFTPKPWWFAEIYAKYARPAGERMSFDAWEVENRFQITERGEYLAELGFLTELERPRDRREGYELTWGPLMQTEWGLIQLNFNALIQQHVQASERSDIELMHQFQLKYRQSKALEWGVQAFGNVGPWNRWRSASLQEFRVGPALFGKFRLGDREAMKWNAALLSGTTSASPRTNFRLQAEYEF